MTQWPTCDKSGCYEPVAQSATSVLHYGTSPVPDTIVLNGEQFSFCRYHAREMRALLQARNNEGPIGPSGPKGVAF